MRLFISESDIGDVNELGLLFKKSSTTKYKYLNGLMSTIPSETIELLPSIVYSGSRKPRHHPNFDCKLYLSNVPSSSTFHFIVVESVLVIVVLNVLSSILKLISPL
jgi:hypothetical protein